jgi:hypothetical protein
MNIKMSATGKFVAVESWYTIAADPNTPLTTMLCFGNLETTVNNTTKTVTLRGNRNQISSLLDNATIFPLRLTTGVAYNLPFDLLYTVITPSSATQSRNQRYNYS